MTQCTITARCDESFNLLSKLVGEAGALLEQLPEVPLEVINLLLRTLEAGPKLASVEHNISATAGAAFVDVSVHRELTDLFADLVSAARARDFDGFILKHKGSPWLGVATPTVAEAAPGVESVAVSNSTPKSEDAA